MRELYIDFDGVLMDTITTSYRLLDEQQVDLDNYDEVLKFYQTLNWEQVIEITPILYDSMDRLKSMKESNRFNISVLTHVNSVPEIVEKVKFIRKYFDDITIIACPKELSKTKMVHAKDAILIDDYSENLREWKAAGGIPVKFSPTKKTTEFLCVDRIDQVLDIL